jgi:nicotinamide mononucleotide transporter
MQQLIQQFVDGMRATTPLEYIAVFSGIASVWFSRKENILVYPVGLVNTVIYVYLSIQGQLYGEASVNFYYTVVSIWGWIIWSRKDSRQQPTLRITKSSAKEWRAQVLFFVAFYIAIFTALLIAKKAFYAATIPWADAFASATAYTGMWLMAKKKVESWWWWIATDIASVPLYFVKGYVFSSVYYFILLVMAVTGLLEWKRRSKEQKPLSFEFKTT